MYLYIFKELYIYIYISQCVCVCACVRVGDCEYICWILFKSFASVFFFEYLVWQVQSGNTQSSVGIYKQHWL